MKIRESEAYPPNEDKVLLFKSHQPNIRFLFESWTKEQIMFGRMTKKGIVEILNVYSNPHNFKWKEGPCARTTKKN